MGRVFLFMDISIEKYLSNLKTVIRGIPNKTASIIQVHKEQILDLNREQQLYNKGIDSDGDKLEPYASFTIQIKQLLKQPYDRTTLKSSGAFHKGFSYHFDKNTYTLTIFSTDKKTTLLTQKYTPKIFGLTEDNKQYLEIQIIKKDLDAWILKYL